MPKESRARRLAGAALLAGVLGAVGGVLVLNLRQRDGRAARQHALHALAGARDVAQGNVPTGSAAAPIARPRSAHRISPAVKRLPATLERLKRASSGPRTQRVRPRHRPATRSASGRPGPIPVTVSATISRAAASAPPRGGGEFGFEQ